MIKRLLNRLQIKQKIIILNLFITGIVFMISAAILFVSVFISFKGSLLNDLTTQARIVAGNSTACLTFNDYRAAREMLAALKASPNIENAAIYAKDGTIFATFLRPDLKVKPPPIPVPKDGHTFSFNELSVVQGVELDKERIGTIYIRSDLKKLHRLLVQHGVVAFVTLFLVFAVAYKLMSKWQVSVIEPIMHLYQVMKLVSWERNYTLRAQVYTEDEIGSLAHGFNAMLEQIQERDMQLQKEIAERRRAEEEVRTLNEGLELKVEEKTKQLLEAREELVRKEKLAVLGQLSGCVGHELRNPLGVMNNAVYYLMNVVPNTDETVREYLEIIKGEIGNSQRIISDLLDFSRTKTPQVTKVPVSDLIRISVDRCVIPHSITLQTSLPDSLPRVKVDPLQMEQVFVNLITNAVQAMTVGGSLHIAARPVEDPGGEEGGSGVAAAGNETLGTGRRAAFVEVSIEDTGGGISPENMKKLFQPLFTTKGRGIGLGLTVCKNLTEANGGRIEAESDLGKGTRFAVILPAEDI